MKLKNTLLPHQVAAVEKLIKLKVGALFMEQGTGKTITTLEIARIRLESGKINSVIWLCPCSAKENIKNEIAKHCPNEVLPVFTICGIETLSSSVRALSYLLEISAESDCFLVVDESLLIKNPRAYRTENILKIAKNCKYRIILNGTPISRNEADLFAQFYLLDWRILGYRSYWSFAANHLEYDERGQIRNVLDVESLTNKISPYAYQVRKSECISLPDKISIQHGFYMTKKQSMNYDYVADRLFYQLDEMKPATIYRMFSGLRAVISGKDVIFENENHFVTREFFKSPMDNPRIKLLLNVLPADEKTIIFCEYDSEISQLCDILGRKAVPFCGRIKSKDRFKNLELFRKDVQYLVANKQCAGYSLNLQFCHNIIYMSHNWDLGTRLQSEDRVHRLGQTEQINIHDIFCYNTIDEAIINCISRKENILESLKDKINNKALLKNIIYGSRQERIKKQYNVKNN